MGIFRLCTKHGPRGIPAASLTLRSWSGLLTGSA
jgi:hypothetical protein